MACGRGDDDQFWVTDGALGRLAKAPIRWRSSKVFQFDTWDAEELTITAKDSVTLTREAGIWEASEGAEVDHAAVQRRLSALADLEAEEFDLVSPVTGAMGEVRLALSGDREEDKPTVVVYTFHRPLTEGGQVRVLPGASLAARWIEDRALLDALARPDPEE